MPVVNLSSNYQLDWDIAQSSQNVSGNTSQVYGRLIIRKTRGYGYWTASSNPWSVSIDGQTFSGSFTYDFSRYSELMLWQGVVTITHNSDGTKTIGSSGYARMDSPWGEASVEKALTLSTIPRASSPSFPNSLVTGNAVTINTNRASGSFTHTITWAFGNQSGTVATGVTDSTTWTPSHSLFNQDAVRNTAAGVGNLTVHTYSGGTWIGGTVTTFTLNLNQNQVPTLTGATFSEATTSPVNIASVIGAYVQSQSKLSYAINGAAGIQGSSISSYAFKVGSVAASGVSGTTGVLQNSGTVAVSATVTDSRGRTSATWTTNISVLAWAAPQITGLVVARALSTGTVDPNGTYLKVSFNAVVSNLTVGGSQKNTLTYLTDTSPAEADTWTNKRNTVGTAPSTPVSFLISTYAENAAWDVRSIVRDRFAVSDASGQAKTLRNIPVATTALDLGPANAGIGRFWEAGALDLGGDLYVRAGNGMPGAAYSEAGMYSTDITVVTNWNAAVTNGAFRSIAGATNAPYSSDAFAGQVFTLGALLIQEVASDSSTKMSVRFSRVYNGTSWTPWRRSDGLMAPGSVTGGTYDPVTGRINLTAGTKVWNFNNIFIPDFRKYRIDYQWYTGDDNGAWFRLRNNTTDEAANEYRYSGIYNNNGSSAAAGAWPANRVGWPFVDGYGHFGHIIISEPMYTAGNTNQKRFQWHETVSSSPVYSNTIGGGNINARDTSSYNGFTISLSDTGKNGIASGSHSWVSVQGLA